MADGRRHSRGGRSPSPSPRRFSSSSSSFLNPSYSSSSSSSPFSNASAHGPFWRGVVSFNQRKSFKAVGTPITWTRHNRAMVDRIPTRLDVKGKIKVSDAIKHCCGIRDAYNADKDRSPRKSVVVVQVNPASKEKHAAAMREYLSAHAKTETCGMAACKNPPFKIYLGTIPTSVSSSTLSRFKKLVNYERLIRKLGRADLNLHDWVIMFIVFSHHREKSTSITPSRKNLASRASTPEASTKHIKRSAKSSRRSSTNGTAHANNKRSKLNAIELHASASKEILSVSNQPEKSPKKKTDGKEEQIYKEAANLCVKEGQAISEKDRDHPRSANTNKLDEVAKKESDSEGAVGSGGGGGGDGDGSGDGDGGGGDGGGGGGKDFGLYDDMDVVREEANEKLMNLAKNPSEMFKHGRDDNRDGKANDSNRVSNLKDDAYKKRSEETTWDPFDPNCSLEPKDEARPTGSGKETDKDIGSTSNSTPSNISRVMAAMESRELAENTADDEEENGEVAVATTSEAEMHVDDSVENNYTSAGFTPPRLSRRGDKDKVLGIKDLEAKSSSWLAGVTVNRDDDDAEDEPAFRRRHSSNSAARSDVSCSADHPASDGEAETDRQFWSSERGWGGDGMENWGELDDPEDSERSKKNLGGEEEDRGAGTGFDAHRYDHRTRSESGDPDSRWRRSNSRENDEPPPRKPRPRQYADQPTQDPWRDASHLSPRVLKGRHPSSTMGFGERRSPKYQETVRSSSSRRHTDQRPPYRRYTRHPNELYHGQQSQQRPSPPPRQQRPTNSSERPYSQRHHQNSHEDERRPFDDMRRPQLSRRDYDSNDRRRSGSYENGRRHEGISGRARWKSNSAPARLWNVESDVERMSA